MTSGDLQPIGPEELAQLEDSYRRAYPLLLRLARGFLRRFSCEDDHEDVVSAAVAKLWVAAHRYSSQKDPHGLPLNRYFESAFALKTLRNESVTAIRAARRLHKHVVPSIQDFDALPAKRDADPIAEKEQEHEEKGQEQRRDAAARRALAELSERDAAIVRAVRFGNFPLREQQRVQAESLFGKPIPPGVFDTAKSRAIARFQEAVDRALASAKSHPKSHS